VKDTFEHAKEKCIALGLKPTTRLIAISIARQLLGFYQDDCLVKSYVISTSLRPPSNIRDSLGTPRGLHEIAEKIGAGQPPGIVFKARVGTGRHYSEFSPEEQQRNLITSRILWLSGLEPGHNSGGDVDSHSRYIYIHGTNHESRLGTPASAGCVQLGNLDMIELFEQVRTKDLVWIED
jgi:L,D-transpeptidase catalytic domain